jgi:DEAD/DEAH box helicase domain-containing protein
MNYITFDIETYIPEGTVDRSGGGKLDTENMRVSVIGAYYSWLDKYLAFYEDDVKDFINTLEYADFVVGYNHIGFDLPVLQKYTTKNLQRLNNYDILIEAQKKIGYRVKLDNIAQNTLGTKKTDNYATFRHYHLEGKWFELTDYCLNDVLITEQIYRKILAGQTLKYSDMLKTFEMVLDLPNKNPTIIDVEPELLW